MTTNRNLLLALALALSPLLLAAGGAVAGEVDPSQQEWYEKYKKQKNAPDPAVMLLNTDPEPDLTEGFTNLFNGRDLEGWEALGGECTFEADGDEIVGTCVPGAKSTYLCTDENNWADLVMTCETFWEVDGNTGVMIRARMRPRKDAGEEPAPSDFDVYGPQVEMEGFEGFAKGRGWSGGIYGQSAGGYAYPLWLKEHAQARAALKPGAWNRLTVHAQGNVVKTWVNGVPAAHWVDQEGRFPEGMLGLQVHQGKRGTIRWRNVKAKRLARPEPEQDPAGHH